MTSNFFSTFRCAAVILAIFYNHSAFSQSDYNLSGVGIFKIGITNTAVIDSIAKSLRCKISKCNSQLKCLSNKDKIVELVPNLSDCQTGGGVAPYHPSIRMFLVRGYKLSGKYSCHSLTLCFMDSLLFEADFDEPSRQLEEDIRLKYGDNRPTIIRQKCNCELGGETLDFDCNSYISEWSNGDINLVSNLLETRLESCKKGFAYKLSLYSSIAKEKAVRLNQDAENDCKYKMNEKKRQKLNGL